MPNIYEFTPEYATVYTPMERIIHTTKVDFNYRNSIPDQVHIVQYDSSIPVIKIDLYDCGEPYAVGDFDCVNVRWFKPDATFVYNPAAGVNADRTSVYVQVTQQMSAAYGTAKAIIEILRGSESIAGTATFEVIIDRNPVSEDGIESTTEFKTLLQYLDEAALFATISRSYAVGDTNYRDGEDTDNAGYYYRMARSWVKGDNGQREGEEFDNGEYYYLLTRSYAAGDIDFREGEEEDNATYYYRMSRSYAVGDSGHREGEEIDNAKYYCDQAFFYYEQFYYNSTSAEAWAVGTRDGIPVTTEDETYHNNSKWYAEESGELYTRNVTIAEELDVKLGLVQFDVDNDGYLIYTDNSKFDFVVDDEGELLWEVST